MQPAKFGVIQTHINYSESSAKSFYQMKLNSTVTGSHIMMFHKNCPCADNPKCLTPTLHGLWDIFKDTWNFADISCCDGDFCHKSHVTLAFNNFANCRLSTKSLVEPSNLIRRHPQSGTIRLKLSVQLRVSRLTGN